MILGIPKHNSRQAQGPSLQVPAHPEKSPDFEGLEGGFPHPLKGPTPKWKGRGKGGYISILPRGKMKPREQEQMPQVMEQGRAKAGTQFQVPWCRRGVS